MINGAHVIVYSKDAEGDRAFFGDVLKFPAVDAGHGWLIFALPAAEAAFHPGENDVHELYFMCDDLKAEMESLKAKNVKCGAVKEERWGRVTTILLPGGGKIGLYQPKHPSGLGGDRQIVRPSSSTTEARSHGENLEPATTIREGLSPVIGFLRDSVTPW